MSRTAIFNFAEGDRLRLRAIGNTGLHSTPEGLETSFGGLLLFPGQPTAQNEEKAQEMFEQFKL